MKVNAQQNKADKPSAGLALGLLMLRHPQLPEIAGGDPCTLIARGDPSRRVKFEEEFYDIAIEQEKRQKKRRICSTWPPYLPPDPQEPDHKRYVEFRERVARKNAWYMA